MRRRALSLAMLLSLLLSGLIPAAVGAAEVPLPDSMAAVGDSITQAASTGGTLGADYPANSWSTGTNSTVNSHYLRLLAQGAPVSGQNHNRSVSGAKMVDLDAQMANVVGLQPDYVTVLIGGNDLCTDTVEQMTSVTSFRAQFEAAMSRVVAGTSAHIYVVSIPDVYQLWELFKGNFWARFIWSSGNICQSLLANPTSTQQVDVDRRAAVKQRNIDYNTQLREVCALHPRCRFDGNAVFSTRFTTNDVSGDYFHPSLAGQAKLSAVSWGAGYTWAPPPPEPNVAPTAGFTSSCADLTCSFTDASSDSDGTIASRSWTFGDGTTSTATNPQRTYAAAGTYTVSLTVTDDDGATASTSGSVTVKAPPAPTPMWVGGLTSSTSSAKSSWTATVTILVRDDAGPLSGVAVSGSWTAGSGTSGCTTSTQGTCQVSVTLNKKATSTTYTVSGLEKAGWVYQPSRNAATSAQLTKP